MKKTLLFVCAMALALGMAKAQVTILQPDLRQMERYAVPDFWPQYPDDFMGNEKAVEAYIFYEGQGSRYFRCVGYQRYTDDTLTVYGLAAAIDKSVNYWGADTSCSHCYTSLMIYEAEGDSLRRLVDSASTYVHVWQKPTYYLEMNLKKPQYDEMWPKFPIYERYFPAPVQVTDSFYVGFLYADKEGYTLDQLDNKVVSISVWPNYDDDSTVAEMTYEQTYNPLTDTYFEGWVRDHTPRGLYNKILFPIVDTTTTFADSIIVEEDTTLSVGTQRLLEMSTVVKPNPARNTARVVSGVGLTRIEAYDVQGTKVADLPVAGGDVTLDVSRWASGVYVLRLHTPMGIVSKRLSVSR